MSCFYSDLDTIGFEQRQTILIFFVEEDCILCPSESQPAAGDAGETFAEAFQCLKFMSGSEASSCRGVFRNADIQVTRRKAQIRPAKAAAPLASPNT